MSIDLERTNLARINVSIAQAYNSALTEAAGGYILREEDFVLTLFPYDNYPYNSVISPRFTSSTVDERLEYLFRVVRSPRR